MTNSFPPRAVPALMLLAFSGPSSAAGFALLEQNASGIGNAYAGSAAVAENASTIFFNPAGMTRLKGSELSLGVSAIRPSFKFTDNGSTNPTAFGGGAATGGDGGDAGSWAAVPNAYAAVALDDRTSFGLGLSAPFGLATEYDDDWKGRFQAISFDLKSINLNPSLAYKVSEAISLGVGVNWQRFEAEYVRQATPAAKVTLDADSEDWGWNAGALFQVGPAMKLGVSYRSAIKHKLEGTFSGALNTGAAAEVELPDTFILSVTQTLDDRWEMLGDVSRTGWGKIEKIDIIRTDTGGVAQTLDTRFKNTWRVALGANYKYSDATKLKFGVAYDESPVDSPADRLVSLPDSDRYWLSVGAQWKLSPSATVDGGLAYLRARDTTINNNQQLLRGTVTGSYEGSVIILGAQYSQSF